MIVVVKVDLPVMTEEDKKAALMGFARAGLTLNDCLDFFAAHQTKAEQLLRRKAHDVLPLVGECEIDLNAAVSLSSAEEDAKLGGM